jgi:quinol monooxygenase YgiN
MIVRRELFGGALAAALAAASAPAMGDTGRSVFHVAIFRFAQEHMDDATRAFRAMASATRKEEGCLAYDIFQSIDDDREFYIVEQWASPEALAAHERSDAFIRFGQGVLTKYATLHDTVTGRPFV